MNNQPIFYFPLTIHNDSASFQVNVPFVTNLPINVASNELAAVLEQTVGAQPQGLYINDGINWHYVMPMTAVCASIINGNTWDAYLNSTLDVTLASGVLIYKSGQLQASQTITHATGIYAARTPMVGSAGYMFYAGAGLTLLGTTFSITPTAVTPGAYTKVTVGQDGRVTAGAALSSGDVTTALGLTPIASVNATGDATGIGSGNSIALTLANSGVGAGTYGQVTVDTKGRVTAAVSLTTVAYGGTGVATLTGLVKGNGTAAMTAAVAGTDYAAPTSGNAILYGDGAGGFRNVTVGSGLTFSGGTLTATGTGGTVTAVSFTAGNGFTGSVATATSTPAITVGTSISGVLKGSANALVAATAGTDYSAGTNALATGILKSTTATGALSIAVAGTDYSAGTSALATGMVKSTTSTGALTIGTAGTDYSVGTSALATGILKSTTTTGALTIAIAADFPTLNQNTTGTAAGLSTTLAVGSGGTGTATAFTANSIVFAGASGVYSQDNTNLSYNSSTHVLSAAGLATGSYSHTGPEVDLSTQLVAPVTGATVNVSAGTQTLLINPLGTLAALTVNMPAAAGLADGTIFRVSTTQTVTALTIASAGATVSGAPTTLAATLGHSWIYNVATTTWFHL